MCDQGAPGRIVGRRDDQALRSGQREVLGELPAGCREPFADLLDAVNVTVADVYGELAGHQGCVHGCRVSRVGPEIGQEQARAGIGGATDSGQKRAILRTTPRPPPRA
jgi:hypothetical protein